MTAVTVTVVVVVTELEVMGAMVVGGHSGAGGTHSGSAQSGYVLLMVVLLGLKARISVGHPVPHSHSRSLGTSGGRKDGWREGRMHEDSDESL